jgi:hypothetical protein
MWVWNVAQLKLRSISSLIQSKAFFDINKTYSILFLLYLYNMTCLIRYYHNDDDRMIQESRIEK